MRRNLTKARLKAGETVFGCFVRYPDASLVELLSHQNWDFLVLDGEHGTLEPRDCENMVRAAELHAVTPIVRVTTNTPSIIMRYMDTGAHGLHVPFVNSAVEARQAVRAVKYQPLGDRGLAAVRAADYAQTVRLSEYVEQANAETLVVIHIETAEAVRQLPEILAVVGVDVIFVGPTDLSHSLGVPGRPDHPEVKVALTEIVETVLRSTITLGMMVADPKSAREWCDRGARYVAIALESLVGPAVRQYLEAVGER